MRFCGATVPERENSKGGQDVALAAGEEEADHPRTPGPLAQTLTAGVQACWDAWPDATHLRRGMKQVTRSLSLGCKFSLIYGTCPVVSLPAATTCL